MTKRGRYYRRGSIWWIQYFFNRKDRRESTRSTKEHVAKKLLTKRMAAKEDGTLQESSLTRMKFADVRAKIEAEYVRNRRKSFDRLQDAFQALGTKFEGWVTSAITETRLEEYVTERLASGKAHATVKYELACLRHAFRLSKLPPLCVPSIRLDNVRKGFFEWPDFCAVLALLPPYLRPVMTMGYLTSWRVQSELLPLQWSQVDFEAGVVKLTPGSTKNKQGRTFPFLQFPELLSLLRTQREAAEQIGKTRGCIVPWVFFRTTKTAVLPIRSYTTAWNNARRKAGYPGRLVHDLRRSGVRALRRSGVPENMAMKLSGHLTRSVFDRYDIVDEKDLGLAVEKLAIFQARVSERRDNGTNYGTVSALPLATGTRHG